MKGKRVMLVNRASLSMIELEVVLRLELRLVLKVALG